MGRNLRQDRPSSYLVRRVDELIYLAMGGDMGRVKFARKRLLQYLARIERKSADDLDDLSREAPVYEDENEPVPDGDLA